MIADMKQDIRRQKLYWDILSYIGLGIFLIFLLFPVLWMTMTAFKANAEITRNELPFGIIEPTLSNFRHLFETTDFFRWVLNSLIVSLSTTVFSVTVGTMAAYALVRLRFFGTRIMGMGIFITYLMPQTLLFIPMAFLIQSIGLYNNTFSLIFVYPTMMVPFCTWLMMGYFRAIPPDMEESARVDGASRWQSFFMITLPLAVPGIISAGIFTFTLSWGEYLYALVLVPSVSLQTIPVGVPSALSQGDVVIWGSIMAAALLGSLPVVLIYGFFMRYFVSGMMVGAVKG